MMAEVGFLHPSMQRKILHIFKESTDHGGGCKGAIQPWPQCPAFSSQGILAENDRDGQRVSRTSISLVLTDIFPDPSRHGVLVNSLSLLKS